MLSQLWRTSVIAVFGCGLALSAQQPPPQPPDAAQQPADPVFRGGTALMEIEVRVTGRGKRPVEGLSKEDFTLLENGVPQQLVNLEYIDVFRGGADEAAAAEGQAASESTSPPAAMDPRTARIFIATHITEAERPRTRRAIQKFIEKDLQPGVLVSLNGTPFVSDKKLLLKLLELDQSLDVLAGAEPDFQRHIIVREGNDPFASTNTQTSPEEPNAQEGPDLIAILQGDSVAERGTVDLLQDQFGRARFYRYIDMIRGLGVYPGKKMIVLFAQGFWIGFDSFLQQFVNLQNNDLMTRLRSESMRARISLYVVDARGLEVGGEISSAAYSDLATELRFTPGQVGAGVPGFVRGSEPITGGMDDAFRNSQNGLKTLAELTDGTAVLNTNDVGEIFKKVREDLSGYYLLGYYPKESENEDDFRKIRITVSAPKVKLSYREGFFDDREFRKFMEAEQHKQLEAILGPSPSATTAEAPLPALRAYKKAYETLASENPNFPRAIEYLDAATKEYEGFAVAWNVLGYSREKTGDFGGAIEAYEKAVEADGDYINPLSHAVRLDVRASRWNKALEGADALIAKAHERTDGHFYRATALFNLGKPQEAEHAVRRVVTASDVGRYAQAYQLLGLIHASEGRFSEATQAYRDYLSVRPEAADKTQVAEQIRIWATVRSLDELKVHVANEKWDDVAELSSQLVETNPRLIGARYYNAMALYRLGETDAAVAQARNVQADERGGDYPGTHQLLGSIFSQQGKLEDAAREYRAYLALVPDSPKAADIQRRLGEWEKERRFEGPSGTTIRVQNPYGDVTMRVMRQSAPQLRIRSPARNLRQGDVVTIQEPGKTTIRAKPSDHVRIDIEIDIPYGYGFEAETADGKISVQGLAALTKLVTQRGDIEIAVPWDATRLSIEAKEPPKSYEPPARGKIAVNPGAAGWGVIDQHDRYRSTYGKIDVRAVSPGRVTLRDIPIPADSPVKMSWQAPAVLESILRAGRGPSAVSARSPSASPTVTTPAASNQESAAPIVFRSGVRMVNLAVSVTSTGGVPSTGLTVEDFEILEDGVPQEISALTAGDAPFNLVLLLDLSGSTVEDRAAMKLAAARFVSTARPTDRIAVYGLSAEMFAVATHLTSDREQLASSINSAPSVSGGTPLYDTIVLAYNEELRQLPGERNALIIVSDGVDNQLASILYPGGDDGKDDKRSRRKKRGKRRNASELVPGVVASASKVPFEQLRQAVAHMDTLIYPYILGNGGRRSFPGGVGTTARENMEALAAASGGRAFLAASVDDPQPFREAAKELRSVYTVAYYPKNQNFDGAWRNVEVRVKRPAAIVRTRAGYQAR